MPTHFAAELAMERGAWLVTADPEFSRVGKGPGSVYSLPRHESGRLAIFPDGLHFLSHILSRPHERDARAHIGAGYENTLIALDQCVFVTGSNVGASVPLVRP